MRRLPKPKPRWAWLTVSTLIPAAVLAVVLTGVLSEAFRDWLLADESGSTTIRNLGLVLAGLIALPLAIWRGLVAQSQANAAQQSLRNERYQKGAEMLGSEVLSVRLGGIYALQRLAREHAREYHVQILRLFCAFARHPTKDNEYDIYLNVSTKFPQAREDVVNIVQAIGKRTSFEIELERKEKYPVGLQRVELPGAGFYQMDFTGINMSKANLSYAMILDTILLNTWLHDANLSGTQFIAGHNLTQEQLDQARAELDNPPDVRGVLDAKTGNPLIWTGGRGEPLKDDE